MVSDVGEGDAEIPYLDVSPADGTTQVTLTVLAPDGTTTPVTVTGGALEPVEGSSDQTQRWTATTPVTYDQPGRWVLHFEVENTGEGAEDYEVYVVASPVAGGPTWTPGRSRVAAYIPHRTLVRSTTSTVTSADAYAWTFDSTTTPPGITVDRLIADGVAWVSARLSPVASSSESAAGVCAAVYAAAMIERSWPDDDQSLQRANDLERRLDVLLKDLVGANNTANDTANDAADYGIEIVPVWQWSADPGSCYL